MCEMVCRLDVTIKMLVFIIIFCIHHSSSDEYRDRFAPRMEYDEWTPLGRGDPLKNDPTYDYMPPILERVHYWMDPSQRTPDPPSISGVLVLGSSRKDQTTPRSTTTIEPVIASRLDTMSFLDPILKLMDVSGLGIGKPYKPPQTYYQIKPRHPQVLQRPPYTILMPPPIPQIEDQLPTYVTITTLEPTPSTVDTRQVTNTTEANPAFTVVETIENLYKPVAINMPESSPNQTDLPEENEMTLPIISMFNNLQQPTERVRNQQQPTETVRNQQPPSEIMTPPPPKKNDDYFVKKWNKNKLKTTTVKTTTENSLLTTDTMFKHYKQPKEAMKGPFYLIIEGHSKVKTYGASKNQITRTTKLEKDDRKGRKIDENEEIFDENQNEKKEMLERKEIQKEKMSNIDRSGRKLVYGISDHVIQGHPSVDLETSYKSDSDQLRSEFIVDNFEDTFSKTEGGKSKKRYLGNNYEHYSEINNNFNRKLLSLNENKKMEYTIIILQDTNNQQINTTAETTPPTTTTTTTEKIKAVDFITEKINNSTQKIEILKQTTAIPKQQLTTSNPKKITKKPKKKKKKVKSTTPSKEDEDDLDKEIGLESLLALTDDDGIEEQVIQSVLKGEAEGSGFGPIVSSIFLRSIGEPVEEKTGVGT